MPSSQRLNTLVRDFIELFYFNGQKKIEFLYYPVFYFEMNTTAELSVCECLT